MFKILLSLLVGLTGMQVGHTQDIEPFVEEITLESLEPMDASTESEAQSLVSGNPAKPIDPNKPKIGITTLRWSPLVKRSQLDFQRALTNQGFPTDLDEGDLSLLPQWIREVAKEADLVDPTYHWVLHNSYPILMRVHADAENKKLESGKWIRIARVDTSLRDAVTGESFWRGESSMQVENGVSDEQAIDLLTLRVIKKLVVALEPRWQKEADLGTWMLVVMQKPRSHSAEKVGELYQQLRQQIPEAKLIHASEERYIYRFRLAPGQQIGSILLGLQKQSKHTWDFNQQRRNIVEINF